jgi:hypothetical protein
MLERIPSPMHAVIAGYRIISNRYCIACRIDRSDWREHCKALHPLSQGVWNDSDWYRRCVSEDKITVPETWRKQILNSTHCCNDEYIPMPWDKTNDQEEDRSNGS